jgi:hypothetical protein
MSAGGKAAVNAWKSAVGLASGFGVAVLAAAVGNNVVAGSAVGAGEAEAVGAGLRGGRVATAVGLPAQAAATMASQANVSQRCTGQKMEGRLTAGVGFAPSQAPGAV